MNEELAVLIARHAETLSAAIEAVETRKNWSPFKDSPSGKFHAPGRCCQSNRNSSLTDAVIAGARVFSS